MPSCFAPSRAIASRDAKLKKFVRNSTAMQPSASNACVSSSSLHSVLTARALDALRVPRVADLEPPVRRVDVEVARRSDDIAGRASRGPRTAWRRGARARRARRRTTRRSSPAKARSCTRAATARRPRQPSRIPDSCSRASGSIRTWCPSSVTGSTKAMVVSRKVVAIVRGAIRVVPLARHRSNPSIASVSRFPPLRASASA